jgi:SAM-dependent methyltransferase
MSTVTATHDWFQTPLGQYLLKKEQDYFDHAVADIFGFNAVQLGLVEFDLLRSCRMPFCFKSAKHGNTLLKSDAHELPVANQSMDLVLLPHVLEFALNPHQVLREAERVLRPEGQLLISAFNPVSLWGLRRLMGQRIDYPWNGRFITLLRIKDWLALLGLEVTAGQMCCYVPPFRREKWIERCTFMESAGERWWSLAGGVYFLLAKKRVRGMRVIVPGWKKSLAAQAMAQTAPKPRISVTDHWAADSLQETESSYPSRCRNVSV